MKYLCQGTVELAAPLTLGQIPLGERRIIPIIAGRFKGEKLKAEVLTGGADWQLVRPDGIMLLDARYTLRTSNGVLIYVQNRGIRSGPPEILTQLAQGNDIDPANYYFRSLPTFETGSPKYSWLNDLIVICSGVRRANAVVLDF